jgi:penicillin G amidase
VTTYVVPPLAEPVEILVDRWGVPHVYAGSADDVFVAQGFNAARDRLFQLDLWRRRGLGLLAEVLGPEYVEHDRAARLFLYRGDLATEWRAYGADTERVTEAFVAGVNAFVALCRSHREHLPPEFGDHLPAYWRPEDVARIRAHGVYSNLEDEVARALTLRDHGPEVEDLRRVREPARPLVVPDGLDLSVIPDDVLRVYRLATGRSGLDGSNNWVLGPSRTASGRPLLANDPHRAVTVPSLRYIAHLSAPGIDAIGAGEPALPGISIGHNGHIAFGLTIFPIDQEDLYVYQTNDRHEYRYQGRWEPMTLVRETVPVRGGPPVPVDLWFTRHGPVVYEGPGTAFAVRAAWLEPGMAPYLGSMDYVRATGPDAFVAAMRRWGAPGENQVYAAPDGTIGWHPAGRVPRRPNWDGTLPVPGDGRYEWDGYATDLPSVRNPEQDWWATANQRNVPAEHGVTRDWYPPFRYERVAEVLNSRTDWTVEACVDLQSDYVSLPARRLQPLLFHLTMPTPTESAPAGTPASPESAAARTGGLDSKVAAALEMLLDWDAALSADSGAAALFEVWFRRHLRPAVLDAALARLVPPERRAAALARILPADDAVGDARVELDLLLSPGDRLSRTPEDIIVTTLADAVAEVERLLGPDPAGWAWGRLHQADPPHLLGGRGVAPGPLPRGGSGETVGATPYTPDFRQTTGATFRMVIDVGDWDSSVAMNSPGQSARPDSPHHHDLFARWAADEAFPLLYTREAIERNLDERIILLPRDA